MANDNHLSSVTLYNVTMISNKHYNEFFELGQQKINFNFYDLTLPLLFTRQLELIEPMV